MEEDHFEIHVEGHGVDMTEVESFLGGKRYFLTRDHQTQGRVTITVNSYQRGDTYIVSPDMVCYACTRLGIVIPDQVSEYEDTVNMDSPADFEIDLEKTEAQAEEEENEEDE